MGKWQCPVEIMVIGMDLSFFHNKRVFLTGHTGFKGSWLCRVLQKFGAEVYGFSLPLEENTPLFSLCGAKNSVHSTFGDIRSFDSLKAAYDKADPHIVLHLAAQPLVRESYIHPVQTYATNVMGTAHLLECVRQAKTAPLSVLNITTDKVYDNKEWLWGYRENEALDGYDPYSNSKSCADLVTHSYQRSYFQHSGVPVSTARAGNVLGGGDFAKDRIIPDCVRAAMQGKAIPVRNPQSIRPYQHVLDPLFAYLRIVAQQSENHTLASSYNVGPNEEDCVCTQQLVDLFCQHWPGATWVDISDENAPHEAQFLALDSAKIKKTLGWKPVWTIEKTVEKTVAWSQAFAQKEDMIAITDAQINDFIKDGTP